MKKLLVVTMMILTLIGLMPATEVKAECRGDFTIEELDGVFTIYYEQLKAHKEDLEEERYEAVYRYLYNVYYRCKNLAEHERSNAYARVYCYSTALDLDELVGFELYVEFTLDELVGFEVPPFIKEDLRKQSSFFSVFLFFLFIYPFSVVKRVNKLSKNISLTERRKKDMNDLQEEMNMVSSENYREDAMELTRKFINDYIALIKYHREHVNLETDLLFMYEFKDLVDRGEFDFDEFVPVFNYYCGDRYKIVTRDDYELIQKKKKEEKENCFAIFSE